MIDEKKLIEELEMHCNNINPNSHLYLVKGAWDDCIKIINRQPKVGEWIPCSERLPNKEENKEYLVTYLNTETHEKTVEQECFFYGVWVKTLHWNLKRIAWMPLPEAYKGEK